MRIVPAVMVAAALATGYASLEATTSCESLAAIAFPDAKITSTTNVAAGMFKPPARGGSGDEPYSTLPAFCRVETTLPPSADSDIKVEVWLPGLEMKGKVRGV